MEQKDKASDEERAIEVKREIERTQERAKEREVKSGEGGGGRDVGGGGGSASSSKSAPTRRTDQIDIEVSWLVHVCDVRRECG